MKVTVIKTVKGKSPMSVSESVLKHDDILKHGLIYFPRN